MHWKEQHALIVCAFDDVFFFVNHHAVASDEFSASPFFDSAVDLHFPVLNELFSLSSGVDGTTKFEKVVEPNMVWGDRGIVGHGTLFGGAKDFSGEGN
ncbi:hypothetical protein KOR42_52800 [Thalassoglobus neptunius]|uniref:Uncharacterized protein n=1 Tax=Thalassoglobus neptunius TaxID=1938619 RepID=A0A5C5VAN8_9PLAN|nr:hypothetical protein KOR42_52800 [Thalassoglobus neptunius]